ncbi:uncharacterized protein TrAtP1_008315 [Trichoderma atroviride]|uniref:uncharacterized protein n=1 Tax=Hypocrea atroviridis TaxID=63577 RepID=UPI0033210583|nr:hypothetical protein TrAtP1_008315 [Trichoderma atroviride]
MKRTALLLLWSPWAMGLCQFLFSLGATRTRPRRSHDDASAADCVPLISASWPDPCRWWAAVGEAAIPSICLAARHAAASPRTGQIRDASDGQPAVSPGSGTAGCASELP